MKDHTNFKTRIGDNNAVGGCILGGEWKAVDTAEIFDNKSCGNHLQVSSTCSKCHNFHEEKYDHQIWALTKYTVYVNDAFVMNACPEMRK